MEDFFQILIILIFIIGSIVSSMRKKKKQQAKKPLPVPVESKANSKQQKQKRSAEILEELMGLKVNLPEPPQKEAPQVYSENSDSDVDTWDPTKEFEVKNDDGYSNYQQKTNAKKAEFDLDRNKYRAFKEEIILPNKIKKPAKKLNLFTNNSNLKDYIIIQEILNKPKSYRR